MNSPPPDRSPWRLLALVAMAAVVAVAALAAGSALARPSDLPPSTPARSGTAHEIAVLDQDGSSMQAELWVMVLLAGSLVACDKPNEPPAKAVAAAKSRPARQGTATAEQVAKDARADVNCPAKNKSAPRAAGAPVDDVIGVRPGMSYDEAVNQVGTMGMPGQERVINVAREERFEVGANHTVASVELALLNKYGPPTKHQNDQGQRYITWFCDLAGRLVTQGAPLFNRCSGNASPNGGVNLSPDCGTVVTAIVAPLRENPDLAMSLQVGVADQADGYQLITTTEQALAQADQQRRAKETANATKNAAAPKL